MSNFTRLAAGAACLLLVSCGDKQPDAAAVAFDTSMPIKVVMNRITDPAAQKFWHSAGGEDTAEGTTSLLPTTDEGWAAAEAAAAAIQESGNMLMLPGRARDQSVWMKYSHDLSEAGKASLAATRARSESQMFETGAKLYEVCQACHVKYYLPYIDANGNPIPGSPLDGAAPGPKG